MSSPVMAGDDDDDDDDDDNSGHGGDRDRDDDDDDDNSGHGGDRDRDDDDDDDNSGHGGDRDRDDDDNSGDRPIRDITVRYSDGWIERIVNGRYELIDDLGRSVIRRPATATDFARMSALG